MEQTDKRLCFPKKQEIETNKLYLLSAKDVLANLFGNNKMNRPLKEKIERDPTVHKFEKMMLEGQWYFGTFTIITIVIGPNGELTTADGAHRVMAMKLAMEKDPTFNPEFYVRFVRARDKKELRTMIDIVNGKDAKDWNLDDHCSMWVENEHPTFCTLLKFCETPEYSRLRLKQKDNGKPLWGKAAMLMGITQCEWKKAYKDGEWYPSKDDIEAVPERYYQVVQLINAFGNDPSNDAWLYVAQDWVNLTRNNADFKYRFSKLPGGLESICKVIKTEFPPEWKQAINRNGIYEGRLKTALSLAESKYK